MRNRSGDINITGEAIYSIDDKFNDVADINSNTPDTLEELSGGMGYNIVGQWSTSFRQYIPAKHGFTQSGSGYGHD